LHIEMGIDGMTKGEREELLKMLKSRARVAKGDIDYRKAEIMADFEAQMARVYDPQDEAFRQVTEEARATVERADQEIAARCRELGIPDTLRPSAHFLWSNRGENATSQRRAELRRVAQTRLDAEVQKAKHHVDKVFQGGYEQLAVGALDSAEARRFLESMPTAESMIVPLDLVALESSTEMEQFKKLKGW
jgi:hypothetical protein